MEKLARLFKVTRTGKLIALIAFIMAFFISRVIYLDADIPPFRLLFISGPDELFWNISGFNLYAYGTWAHKVFDFLPPDELPFTAVQNFMTFLGLKLFGNNFYGLRISPVVCGAIVAICVIYVLNKQAKGDASGKTLPLLLVSIYMLFDFFFLESNRFNEPTIFSMAAIASAMAILSITDKRNGKAACYQTLACGILAGSSFTFVYIYNIYWAAALGATVLVVRYKEGRRQMLIHFLLFALGALVSVGVFLIFLRKAYNMNFDYYLAFMKGIGGRGTNRVPLVSNLGQFITLVSNNHMIAIKEFLTSNLFRYNPALLFLFLSSIPVFIVKIVREQRSVDVFVLLLLIFRICLSVLIPHDWYEKKLVQIYPCVAYIIGAALIYGSSMSGRFVGGRIRFSVLAYALALIAFAVLTYNVMCKEFMIPYRPVEFIGKYEFFLTVIVFPLLLMPNMRVRKIALVALLVMALLPSLRLSYHFVYSHATYKRRDALIAMSQRINGKVLAGGVSFATRLYNTSVPVINFYNYYYYGSEQYNRLCKDLYESRAVAGTVLYIPLATDPRHFFAPTIDFIQRGGLVLDSEYDLGEDDNLKYGIFVVPPK